MQIFLGLVVGLVLGAFINNSYIGWQNYVTPKDSDRAYKEERPVLPVKPLAVSGGYLSPVRQEVAAYLDVAKERSLDLHFALAGAAGKPSMHLVLEFDDASKLGDLNGVRVTKGVLWMALRDDDVIPGDRVAFPGPVSPSTGFCRRPGGDHADRPHSDLRNAVYDPLHHQRDRLSPRGADSPRSRYGRRPGRNREAECSRRPERA